MPIILFLLPMERWSHVPPFTLHTLLAHSPIWLEPRQGSMMVIFCIWARFLKGGFAQCPKRADYRGTQQSLPACVPPYRTYLGRQWYFSKTTIGFVPGRRHTDAI